MAGILFGAAATCLLLFLHPYVTYIASLRLLRDAPSSSGAAPIPTTATLVFAAYNEADVLPQKLANLRVIKQLWPDIEIIAFSDGSSDDTVARLEAASDILCLMASAERVGKATGMQRMVSQARGEIVIFTDANVILEPASIAPLLACFGDPEVGGVAGTLRYSNADAAVTAHVGGLYWRLEEAIKRQESRVGSIMGADGSIFAMRRALYPQVPPQLLDDMIASLAVTFAGFRLIHSRRVIAYEKSATSAADEFRRKRRIACRAFQTHRFLWPRVTAIYRPLDIYKYVSHKLMRWLGLVPLVLAGAFLAAGLMLTGQWPVLATAAGGLMVALVAGWAGLPWFGALYQALAAIAATSLGWSMRCADGRCRPGPRRLRAIDATHRPKLGTCFWRYVMRQQQRVFTKKATRASQRYNSRPDCPSPPSPESGAGNRWQTPVAQRWVPT